jgi:hypothetical protein
MNYKEVKKEIKIEFESFLKPLGYGSKIDSQGCEFFKKINGSLYRIGYGITNYIDEFNTGCYIGIGHLGIQKILYFIEGIFDVNDNYGSTLGSNIGLFFNNLNYRYEIKSREDINKWGQIAREFYNNYAVPFFQKYSSLDAIDKLLNDNPTEKVIYLDDLGWRIIKGLIAAKLNSNPKYPELRAYYKSEVESKFQGYFMYEKCMKTIEFLDRHKLEELEKIIESQKDI